MIELRNVRLGVLTVTTRSERNIFLWKGHTAELQRRGTNIAARGLCA